MIGWIRRWWYRDQLLTETINLLIEADEVLREKIKQVLQLFGKKVAQLNESLAEQARLVELNGKQREQLRRAFLEHYALVTQLKNASYERVRLRGVMHDRGLKIGEMFRKTNTQRHELDERMKLISGLLALVGSDEGAYVWQNVLTVDERILIKRARQLVEDVAEAEGRFE